jgi:hypothetical protein
MIRQKSRLQRVLVFSIYPIRFRPPQLRRPLIAVRVHLFHIAQASLSLQDPRRGALRDPDLPREALYLCDLVDRIVAGLLSSTESRYRLYVRQFRYKRRGEDPRHRPLRRRVRPLSYIDIHLSRHRLRDQSLTRLQQTLNNGIPREYQYASSDYRPHSPSGTIKGSGDLDRRYKSHVRPDIISQNG